MQLLLLDSIQGKCENHIEISWNHRLREERQTSRFVEMSQNDNGIQ